MKLTYAHSIGTFKRDIGTSRHSLRFLDTLGRAQNPLRTAILYSVASDPGVIVHWSFGPRCRQEHTGRCREGRRPGSRGARRPGARAAAAGSSAQYIVIQG